jgi:hemerythrin-like domain-containing protein
MDAIETLMHEHRLIERVLDAMVLFTDQVRRSGTTDREELARFVTFLREFADECHHGKEEGVLFAAMVEHGFPAHGGPVAVMLHEHAQGRALVRALQQKSEQAEWTDQDRDGIAGAAESFAGLLRAHIHKEDAVLYPMAEQHLPPEAMERVGRDCERFEAERTGAGAHERLHALAGELVARHAGAGRAAHPGEPRPAC